MISLDAVLIGHFDAGKVVLSVLLAMMGAYCAIELGARVSSVRGRTRLGWLVGGALVMGIGTWSMHYMGMFAFVLPIPVQYDWPAALLSYGFIFFASGVALFVVSRPKMDFRRAMAGSIFMGIGISGLHYIAMASMRMDGMHRYWPPLVILSVALAIALSYISLRVMFAWREPTASYNFRKPLSTFLLGAAIPAMHYTAMASVTFYRSAEFCDLSRAVPISTLGIVAIVTANVALVVVMALTSMIDRVQRHRALLDALFEQAPQPVALLEPDQRIVRVNQEFVRVFGYTAPESVGRNIGELIAPADGCADEDQHTELAVQGQRLDAEGVRIRKDGTRLDVAMIRVPVFIASGKILVYAIYRDITESKKAREALQRSNEQLHVLSHRIFKVQEEEKRHLARELHDVMGQALTAATISLQSARNAEDIAGVRRRLDDGLSILELLLQQAKQLSLDLRPPLLDDLGLVPALRWYLDQQAQRAGFRVEFFASPSFERIAAEIETACFRVAQEAVTNVVRHAQAKTVAVRLDRTADALHLVVRDDGIGFDAPAALGRVERDGNLGLLGMRERVSLVGGELDIKSGPGGTEVHAFFPVDSSGHVPGVAP